MTIVAGIEIPQTRNRRGEMVDALHLLTKEQAAVIAKALEAGYNEAELTEAEERLYEYCDGFITPEERAAQVDAFEAARDDLYRNLKGE